jgi:hypothetical protein
VVSPPTTVDGGGALTWTLPAADAADPAGAGAGGKGTPADGSGADKHTASAPREPGSVLPRAPESETAAAWGDGPDSNDARLTRDVPPHW